ncbi:NAD(P)-dependent oxidoreductase [Salinisphaera orenii]|uniref:NAD(P)-dependent oxidoreductase n=1 Tax=Salinisphaera orenii TaxID=856731 RepID=UPI000DBE8D5E
MPLTGCFLDTGTLPGALDWAGLTASLDNWHWHHNTAPDDLAARLSDVDVAVTNKIVLDANTLAAAPHLKLVGIAATGINNIDKTAARQHGIDVVNVTNYATESVCQQVFAFILARASRVTDYDQLVKTGGWTESEFFCRMAYPVEQIADQTLVIVGGGDIGNAVAAAGRGFGMRVVFAERPGADTVRADRLAFNEALAEADALSLHCPLTDATRDLIDADALARMKSTAMVIDTARGGLINASALANALRAGEIGSAAIDVLDAEPPPATHPLLAGDIPNLTINPHVGWASQTARQRVLDQLTAKITAFTHGESLTTVN